MCAHCCGYNLSIVQNSYPFICISRSLNLMSHGFSKYTMILCHCSTFMSFYTSFSTLCDYLSHQINLKLLISKQYLNIAPCEKEFRLGKHKTNVYNTPFFVCCRSIYSSIPSIHPSIYFSIILLLSLCLFIYLFSCS